MKYWGTTADFIANGGKGVPVGTVLDLQGDIVAGDNLGVRWKKTSTTGTASTRVNISTFNDATGYQWKLVCGEKTEIETFDDLQTLQPEDGDFPKKFTCIERANAEYLLQPPSYVALAGDVTFANGRVAALQIDGKLNVLRFGADKTGAVSSKVAIDDANSRCPIVGSTTDDPSYDYRNGTVYFPAGKYLIAQGEQIDIPLGVSWEGDCQNINYNITGLNNEAFGSTIWVENTTVFPVITISGKQLRGSAASMTNMKFSHGSALRGGGPYAGTLFEPVGLFLYEFINCTFFELGYTAILKPLSSNGVRLSNCNFIKIGDAQSQQSMPPVSGFTYGTAIDFSTCYDSFIDNVFVESCGGFGAIISTNTKISNSFIDLCYIGVKSQGDRNQIVGSSIKWNQRDGVQLSTSDGIIISSSVIMGNNYSSLTDIGTMGFGIRFLDNATKYFNFSALNMVDDYEDIPSHAAYKTVRQGGIHLGTSANSTGVVNGVIFSDKDAQWVAAVTDNYPIYDPVGLITGLGKITVGMCQIESAGPVNLIHSPFTTVSASTLGTVSRRIPYRDSEGTVIGQIPLYNSIT